VAKQVVYLTKTPIGAVTPLSFNVGLSNLDGTGAKLLTRNTKSELDSVLPEVSPNGATIVYNSRTDLSGVADGVTTATGPGTPANNLWLMSVDGTSNRPLTTFADKSRGAVYPFWSRDGRNISFNSTLDLSGDAGKPSLLTANVWQMDADGTGLKPITQHTAPGAANSAFGFVLGGSIGVLFSSNLPANGDWNGAQGRMNLWKIGTDGTGLTRLTAMSDSSENLGFATLTPDGKKIVYAAKQLIDGQATEYNLWVMDPDGANAHSLTRGLSGQTTSYNVALFPDSARVAFLSNMTLDGNFATKIASGYNLWVMNLDGTGLKPLTTDGGLTNGNYLPAVTPDGKSIFYSTQASFDGSAALLPCFNVWSMNADGTGKLALTRNATVNQDSVLSSLTPFVTETVCR
jgi:Tol biopolymer transport system component